MTAAVFSYYRASSRGQRAIVEPEASPTPPQRYRPNFQPRALKATDLREALLYGRRTDRFVQRAVLKRYAVSADFPRLPHAPSYLV